MILIGFADDRAQSAPQIVAGPEVSIQEQARILASAKASQQFPDGIRRLEFCAVEPRDIAIAVAAPAPRKNKK